MRVCLVLLWLAFACAGEYVYTTPRDGYHETDLIVGGGVNHARVFIDYARANIVVDSAYAARTAGIDDGHRLAPFVIGEAVVLPYDVPSDADRAVLAQYGAVAILGLGRGSVVYRRFGCVTILSPALLDFSHDSCPCLLRPCLPQPGPCIVANTTLFVGGDGGVTDTPQPGEHAIVGPFVFTGDELREIAPGPPAVSSALFFGYRVSIGDLGNGICWEEHRVPRFYDSRLFALIVALLVALLGWTTATQTRSSRSAVVCAGAIIAYSSAAAAIVMWNTRYTNMLEGAMAATLWVQLWSLLVYVCIGSVWYIAGSDGPVGPVVSVAIEGAALLGIWTIESMRSHGTWVSLSVVLLFAVFLFEWSLALVRQWIETGTVPSELAVLGLFTALPVALFAGTTVAAPTIDATLAMPGVVFAPLVVFITTVYVLGSLVAASNKRGSVKD